jgi:hypothetical protein
MAKPLTERVDGVVLAPRKSVASARAGRAAATTSTVVVIIKLSARVGLMKS